MAGEGVLSTTLRTAVNIIGERDKFTRISETLEASFVDTANTSVLGITNYPSYDVYKLNFDKNKRGLSVFLSGPPVSIALQESLINAIYDVVNAHNPDNQIDLNEWIQDFQQCFPSFGVKGAPYNNTGLPWGGDPSCIPRVRILRSVIRDKQTKYSVLQFWPDSCNKEESYMISGTSAMCIMQINQLYNQWLMLKNKEIGQWVGYPIDEDLRRYPRNYLTVQFILTTNKKPPFYLRPKFKKKRQYTSTTRGIYKPTDDQFEPFRRIKVTVPIVDRTKINYENLRACCGGSQGLVVGYWGATTEIGNNSLKGFTTLEVRGDTFETAIANSQKFLSITSDLVLSNPKPFKLINSENADKIDGNYEKLKSYRVYPAKVLITTSTIQASKDNGKGRKIRTGVQHARAASVDIWDVNPPADWKKKLADVGL